MDFSFLFVLKTPQHISSTIPCMTRGCFEVVLCRASVQGSAGMPAILLFV